MARIFISYRRDDSFPYASQIGEKLGAAFGTQAVFLDLRSIDAGEEFPAAIENTIKGCRVFLVLIGKRWLSAQDASGARRLDNAEDWVRREVLTARDQVRHVIPVLVGGAGMPAASEFPEQLSFLAARNAVELRDSHFDIDCDALVDKLSNLIKQRRKDRGQGRRLAAWILTGMAGLATVYAITLAMGDVVTEHPLSFAGSVVAAIAMFWAALYLRRR